ncbi:MAG: Dam family site-specific DNA-(adenine-N6)-methyltransferase [Bacteroidaceae bacterium]|nr:Dam family site-specific DNA-(adenine-N6)-methyltransferase [Bacteroidaceae bacterium]
MNQEKSIAKPFVKWVGGKGQLLPQLKAALPNQLYDKDFTYIEPFVGGGAMLFFMLQHFPNIKKAVINDLNENLANAYRSIKEHPEQLIDLLRQMEREYLPIKEDEKRRSYYTEIRRQFNDESIDSTQKAALLLFLNRTCFNGLYRENSKGKFNVPFGRYTHPTICNEELIYTDSELLNAFDVQILSGDYSQTAHEIESHGLNFFYFDPPYRPLSATSSFNTYVKEAFGDKEQARLADFCQELSTRGNCLWMLSNSDCSSKNPSDTFIEDLYQGFHIDRVFASRCVNANGNKRGKLTEVLIDNYSLLSEFRLSAEELLCLSDNKEDFTFEFCNGDTENLFFSSKYQKDIAKTKNYKPGYYYHAEGGLGECGVGHGLYLGKDKMALHNFYNGEGEFGHTIDVFYGFPKFIDLSLQGDYDQFENEAIELYGKDEEGEHLKKMTLAKGYDGIRYFDLYTTGEEFVLYTNEKIKQLETITI